MKDQDITGVGQWSPAIPLQKGEMISVSVKGTFVGTIVVRRWLYDLGQDIPADKYIGVISEIDEPTEAADWSPGKYFYQAGCDDTWSSGTATINLT